MLRRPPLVGALVALVGVALVLLGMQRDADVVSEASAPISTSTSPRPSPSPSPSLAPPIPDDALTVPSGSSEPVVPVEPTEEASPVEDPAPAQAAPATAEPPPRPAAGVSTGASLRIPGIGLRAGLHGEGLRSGKINPPSGTVMWFTGYDRVSPGAVGTSVIAGHVVAGGRPDVFANLSRVGVGDRVEVTGTDGVARAFRVVRAGVVDKNELTTDQAVWGGNSSVRRLAIITCDDAYGFRGDGHRVANYVVIAEPA